MSQPLSVTIVDKTPANTFVNHCFNLTGLASHLTYQGIKVTQDIIRSQIPDSSHLFLLVHNFDKWPADFFRSYLDSIKTKALVIPTQLADKKVMLETFNHPAISKVLIFSDFMVKYFTKTLEMHQDKVKSFNINFSLDIIPEYKLTKEKIILVPSLVEDIKNFEFILEAFEKIRRNNRFLYLVFFLQKSPEIDDTTFAEIINKFKDKLVALNKWDWASHVRIITKSKNHYIDYLNAAYMVVLPTKKVNNIYSNLLLDAISAGKALVVPEDSFNIDTPLFKEGFTFDICKAGAGAIFYNSNSIESLIEATNIVFDNSNLRKILEEQNLQLAHHHKGDVNNKKLANFIKRSILES